jgi:imidazolonepropionase-like amidohydrolase
MPVLQVSRGNYLVARLTLLLSIAGCLLCGSSACSGSAASWTLTHVAVVDVVSGRVAMDQTVRVTGARVAGIEPTSAMTPAGRGEQIDASGLWLVPGLFNMHAHVFCEGERCGFQPHLARYSDAGVLGIRDMGSPLDPIANAAKNAILVPPRIWFTGPILDGPRASADSMRLVVSEAPEAESAVAKLAAGGATFVKVHDWLSRASYGAVVEAADRHHLPVVGHIPLAITLDDAIAARQHSIEHLGGLTHAILRACGRPDAVLDEEILRRGEALNKGPAYQLLMSAAYLTPLLDTFDPVRCGAVAQRLADARIWQTPTLVMWQSWAQSVESGSSDDKAARRRLYETVAQVMAIFYRAGVTILAGTDETPGSSVQEEVELLVRAGLPPLAALQTATINAAAFLGVEESYSPAPGHSADFVLVGGNPLADIATLRRVRMVVWQGHRQAVPP